jgi:methylthioribulose-1-phosphate dehydratase
MNRVVFELVAPERLAELIAFGRLAAGKGWLPATSGNLSMRAGDAYLITRSGVDKGALEPNDFIQVALEEDLLKEPEMLAAMRVSAEAPLHVERYLSDPAIGAVLHVHTVAATVLSRADAERGSVRIEGFEMQKALDGIKTHEGALELPVFENAQDTSALAERVRERLGTGAAVPGYLLAGHGMYAWGRTVAEARRHVEGLEFLLCCALEERRIRS